MVAFGIYLYVANCLFLFSDLKCQIEMSTDLKSEFKQRTTSSVFYWNFEEQIKSKTFIDRFVVLR